MMSENNDKERIATRATHKAQVLRNRVNYNVSYKVMSNGGIDEKGVKSIAASSRVSTLRCPSGFELNLGYT